jgi:hypothetical protein
MTIQLPCQPAQKSKLGHYRLAGLVEKWQFFVHERDIDNQFGRGA